MTYDNELTLIGSTIAKDEIGQEVETPTETTVLCGLKSVGRNEFYSAAQAGLKPTLIFEMHGYEYNEEKKIIFGTQEYKVIRTYSPSFEVLELTCERVGANG